MACALLIWLAFFSSANERLRPEYEGDEPPPSISEQIMKLVRDAFGR